MFKFSISVPSFADSKQFPGLSHLDFFGFWIRREACCGSDKLQKGSTQNLGVNRRHRRTRTASNHVGTPLIQLVDHETSFSTTHIDPQVFWCSPGSLSRHADAHESPGHNANLRVALDLLAGIQKHTAHIGYRTFNGTSKITPKQLDLFETLNL